MLTTELNLDDQADQVVEVIRRSHLTVAKEFNITEQNAPSNPAFIKKNVLLEKAREKEIEFFGYYEDNKLVGCYALENAENGVFYLERLSVLPEKRRRGLGKKLVWDSFKRVKHKGGLKMSIAIINERTVLKDWYKAMGFFETGIKTIPRLPFDVCFLEYEL